MVFTKTFKHVAIANIVVVVALITFAYPYYLQDFLNVVRGLQFAATLVLIYGIFKKDPLHKDKFVLFWLALTAFFFISLVYCSFEFIAEDFDTYYIDYFFASLGILLAEYLAIAVVGYSLHIFYQEYVELTQNNREAGLSLPGVNNINPTIETKEAPPPYIAPTSENMSVSIQS